MKSVVQIKSILIIINNITNLTLFVFESNKNNTLKTFLSKPG